jgi:hypothetical protein
MSAGTTLALERAVDLSHQLLTAADQANFEELALLDAERLRLLQSVRLQRDSLSEGDRLLLAQVGELNDRAIGLMEHQRRIKGRAMDMAAVGRRAITAYATNRARG